MNDFEDQLRRALRTDVLDVEPDRLLDAVHRGATRRRRRRTATVVAASLLVIAGAAGVATTIRGDERTGPEPLPATHTPSPSPSQPSPSQSSLPDGAEQGVVDVSAPSADLVLRLTWNVGCVGCSTVWRQDASVTGGWERLFDFTGRAAFGGKVDPDFGPVTNLAMAPNGLDGLAWGARLFATHDGGRTWTLVTDGPGPLVKDFATNVELTRTDAWALVHGRDGMELWRAPLGTDNWSLAQAPDVANALRLITVGDEIALEETTAGSPSHLRMQHSTDGRTWRELPLPCGGESQVSAAGSTAFILCTPAGNSSTVYRTTDLTSWHVFGRSTPGGAHSILALAPDRLLIVTGPDQAKVMTSDGTRPADLGLSTGEDIAGGAATDQGGLLTSDAHRLIESTDAGLTWHVAS